jgi:hypothetical protein
MLCIQHTDKGAATNGAERRTLSTKQRLDVTYDHPGGTPRFSRHHSRLPGGAHRNGHADSAHGPVNRIFASDTPTFTPAFASTQTRGAAESSAVVVSATGYACLRLRSPSVERVDSSSAESWHNEHPPASHRHYRSAANERSNQ